MPVYVDRFYLDADEFISAVSLNLWHDEGSYTSYNGCPTNVVFHTDKGRTYGPYGDGLGGSKFGVHYEMSGYRLAAVAGATTNTTAHFKNFTLIFNAC